MSAAAPGGGGMNGAGGAGPGGHPRPPLLRRPAASAREAPRPGDGSLPGVLAGGRSTLGARLNSGYGVFSAGQCLSLSEPALGGSRGCGSHYVRF